MSKTILITGTSSGFGRDMAETLARGGYTVYAAIRGSQGKNRTTTEALQKQGINTVELDVNDDAPWQPASRRSCLKLERLTCLSTTLASHRPE